MKIQAFCEGDSELLTKVSHLEDLGELHALRLVEFSKKLPVSLESLIISAGAACIDTEYGADVLGLLQFVESRNIVGKGKITIGEPVRVETKRNGIDKIHHVYKKYANKMGHNLAIIRDDEDGVLGLEKYGAIFWLNMYPEFCNVSNLVSRLHRCRNNLINGGVALLTQLEYSMYEEERYEKVMKAGIDDGLNLKLVTSLGMLGSIGILLEN